MRRLIVLLGLQAYAVALALFQQGLGLRTDEAKYLLNIPYPHPPLARWFFSQFEFVPWQELGVRILLATLLVSAIWFLWDASRSLRPRLRGILCSGWLLSAAFLFQAGSIMMAPLTALQGLLFLWLLAKDASVLRRSAGWIALLWLVTLFTAYQGILWFPIVAAIFWKMRLRLWQIVLAFVLPIALLALYSLSNPLALASFVLASEVGDAQPMAELFRSLSFSWALAGNVVFGVLGVAGMILGARWALLSTFLFFSIYAVVSFHDYYAIFFLPLFVFGTLAFLEQKPLQPVMLGSFFLAMTVVLWMPFHPRPSEQTARSVMAEIREQGKKTDVLICGSFGHQWQYESVVPVRRYDPEFLPSAQAVVCLESCEEMPVTGFEKLPAVDAEVWVRR